MLYVLAATPPDPGPIVHGPTGGAPGRPPGLNPLRADRVPRVGARAPRTRPYIRIYRGGSPPPRAAEQFLRLGVVTRGQLLLVERGGHHGLHLGEHAGHDLV